MSEVFFGCSVEVPWVSSWLAQLGGTRRVRYLGRVRGMRGQVIDVSMPAARYGAVCFIDRRGSLGALRAEVIGLHPLGAYLAPLGGAEGVELGAGVMSAGEELSLLAGPHLLGQIVDGFGVGTQAPGGRAVVERRLIDADPPDINARVVISEPLVTGVRAIDALMTCGKGQRVGIFAGAGVGKSALLGMILRHSEEDIIVLALVGERGREVGEFVRNEIGEKNMRRAVLVVATSDRPAAERARAAYTATAIAEYFRDQGKNVLLMVDSLTRYARAQREIGLAAGEPATRGGYPPSVFSNLPRIVERAGRTKTGCISAFYTVLVEGDDTKGDPVGEEIQSLLDGHIVLARDLANEGLYPAIDVLRSVSRVMQQIVPAAHSKARSRFVSLLVAYNQSELLVRIGEYRDGADPITDEAIAKRDYMRSFLMQEKDEKCLLKISVDRLRELMSIEASE